MIDFALFRDVLASEWTKLRSVRSTVWSIVIAIAVGIGLGVLISWANAHAYPQMSPDDRATFDPTSLSTAGLFFAQLALGVMAIMTITAEYSTGTIRTSIAAVPQRGYLLAAKAALVGFISVIVGLVAAFASFLISQVIFNSHHLGVPLGDPGVLRAVIGAGLDMGVLVLFAMGIAVIMRHTAGAITILVGVVFILPIVTGLLPDHWKRDLGRYLPAQAGGAITNVVHSTTSLSPWAGFAVFIGWAALTLGTGWYLLRHRDV